MHKFDHMPQIKWIIVRSDSVYNIKEDSNLHLASQFIEVNIMILNKKLMNFHFFKNIYCG